MGKIKVKDFSNLYGSDYFKNRSLNDLKRMQSFEKEKHLLKKYVNFSGVVCDIGCSTGEFLTAIDWRGEKFGMEVNEDAIQLAKASGISFEKNILNSENYFDAIIFRGTIQHIPDPFGYIQKSYEALKKGGYIIFLATPNANSVVYKLFNTLPALNPRLNFFIPSDITLKDVLENFDFDIIEVEKPYLKSPYANPLKDHANFIKCIISSRRPNFPFWGSMMNLVAVKK